MLKSYSGSNGPGSGDIGGGLEASLESPAAFAPVSAPYEWHTYDQHSDLAQEEQEQPPEYFSITAGDVDANGPGKFGLPSKLTEKQPFSEKAWQPEKMQMDSKKRSSEFSSSSAAPIAPAASSSMAAEAEPPSFPSSSMRPVPRVSVPPSIVRAPEAGSATITRSNTRSGVGGIKLHSSDKNATFGHK